MAADCLEYGSLPRSVVEYEWDGFTAANAFLSGDHLCVADDSLQIEWFRIDQDGHPVREGGFVFPEGTSLYAVGVLDDLAVVNLHQDGYRLAIVDFAAPEAPVLVSEIDAPGQGEYLDVGDSHVYVGVQDIGLWIVDLTNHEAPVTSFEIPIPALRVMPRYVDGTCWVLACGNNTNFVTYDVCDPLNPIELGQIWYYDQSYTPPVHDGEVVAIVTQRIENLGWDGPWIRVHTLRVFDANDSTNLEPIRHVDDCPGGMLYAMADGIYYQGSVQITASRFDEQGQWQPLYTIYPQNAIYPRYGIYPHSSSVLVTDGATVWSLNEQIRSLPMVSEPVPPFEFYKRSFSCSHHDYSTCLSDLSVDSDLLFVISKFADDGPGSPVDDVNVYDLSIPTDIRRIADFSVYGGYMGHVTVNGEHLYIEHSGTWHWPTGTSTSWFWVPDPAAVIENAALYAGSDTGLDVYDLVDPAEPVLIDHILDGHDVSAMLVHNDLVYVFGGLSVIVLDAGDPLAPIHINEFTVAAPVVDGAVGGGVLSLACEDGLHTFDLTDPTYPRPLGTLPGYLGTSIVASGSIVYLYAVGHGIVVLDVSDPTVPLDTGAYECIDWKLTATDQALISYYNRSLNILPLDCRDPLPVLVRDMTLAWVGDGVRLEWELSHAVSGLRLTASLGASTWTVPWRDRDGRYVAYDWFDNSIFQ